MNDVGAQPVPADEIPDHERHAASILQDKQALYVRINRGLLGDAIVNKAIVLALCGVIYVMLPLKEFIPQFVGFDYANNIYEVMHDVNELGDKKDDVVTGTLWTAIRNCEGYYFEGAPWRYKRCSALLTGKAQHEYQQWFLHDPASPQTVFGSRGHIHIDEEPNSVKFMEKLDVCKNADFCEATLSYWQTEQLAGSTPQRKHITADMSFIFVDQIHPGERATFNPAALKIIAYHKDCENCR